jgi:hypothetical protein
LYWLNLHWELLLGLVTGYFNDLYCMECAYGAALTCALLFCNDFIAYILYILSYDFIKEIFIRSFDIAESTEHNGAGRKWYSGTVDLSAHTSGLLRLPHPDLYC